MFPHYQFLLCARGVVLCFVEFRYGRVFTGISRLDGAENGGEVAVAAPGIGVALVVDGVAELLYTG